MNESLPDLADYLDDLLLWHPRDQDSATALHRLSLGSPELHPLAEFHADHGRRSAIIAFDSAATCDPGARSILALHLERDLSRREFSLTCGRFPTPPLASRWLASLGVPVESIQALPKLQRSTDPQTRLIEEHLSRSGDRYRLVWDYTGTDNVRTLFEDQNPEGLPRFLAHFQTASDPDCALDYHVRQARFGSPAQAQAWFLTANRCPRSCRDLT